ncbi:MAG: hypothetical protein VB025_13215 [Sphaerochaeta sp.]|nr:hypothetical protein [Sphaerochaeta sp.]
MGMKSGGTNLTIVADEQAMGLQSAALAVASLKQAVVAGKHPVMWMMAAPSGFSFYKAFANAAKHDEKLRSILKETEFYQFDDYPVGPNDPRFPITFRHLLETSFFGPLEQLLGPLPGKQLLDLQGDANDDQVARDYQERLLVACSDPKRYVLEIKGIGMDGHWGFHGSETPLNDPAAYMRVPMNALNVQQQMLDWPQYFPTAESVPTEAYTANVALFMQADMVIDLVPQAGKAFAVLACYGPKEVSNLVPSSKLKDHPNSHAFLTEAASWALMEYRRQQKLDPKAVGLDSSIVERLLPIWRNQENAALEEHNKNEMLAVLGKLF